eukprot:Skav227810  [mRNA]  locus=scaffold948:159927:161959:+ [translate_table: standard]
MDFSGLEAGRLTKNLTVPQDQARPTTGWQQLLIVGALVTGAYEIEVVKQKRSIEVTGTAAQLEKAEKALQRVVAHCNWGANDLKIRSILRPRLDYKAVAAPRERQDNQEFDSQPEGTWLVIQRCPRAEAEARVRLASMAPGLKDTALGR